MLLKSLIETSGYYYHHMHIACVKPRRVWVSDGKTLMLMETGMTLYGLGDSLSLRTPTGKHIVDNDRELIYIDNHFNVSKISEHMKKPRY